MAEGALSKVRVLEFEGMGPVPLCGMMLSDHGADVIQIKRAGGKQSGAPLPTDKFDILARGRRTISLDLKDPASVALCLDLIERSDALLEGFRPNVMERIGLGPDVALERNPKLAYARMTGWGQTGPYALTAGHDINYIAVAGVLHAIGTEEKPIPPLNLVGDFGGGAMFMAFGVLAAILQARTTGLGQVIDCAMTDGAATLMAPMWGLYGNGQWRDRRGANLIDGGAHFYGTYRCSDGEWIAVSALEPAFYQNLLAVLGLDDPDLSIWGDPSRWPDMKARISAVFASQPRKEWIERFEGTEACFSPVLSMSDALNDSHNLARGTYVEVEGVAQPAPAPRFTVTPGMIRKSEEVSITQILDDWLS